MQKSQQLNENNVFRRASLQQRLLAAIVLVGIVALFGLFYMAGEGKFDINRWLGPCGFKQRYHGLPCPTCGVTTSAIAFSGGEILKSFYIQPAGCLLCCLLVVLAFLAFLVSVFGVYFAFLERFFRNLRIIYVILGFVIIITAGWAVTLTRALADGR